MPECTTQVVEPRIQAHKMLSLQHDAALNLCIQRRPPPCTPTNAAAQTPQEMLQYIRDTRAQLLVKPQSRFFLPVRVGRY